MSGRISVEKWTKYWDARHIDSLYRRHRDVYDRDLAKIPEAERGEMLSVLDPDWFKEVMTAAKKTDHRLATAVMPLIKSLICLHRWATQDMEWAGHHFQIASNMPLCDINVVKVHAQDHETSIHRWAHRSAANTDDARKLAAARAAAIREADQQEGPVGGKVVQMSRIWATTAQDPKLEQMYSQMINGQLGSKSQDVQNI